MTPRGTDWGLAFLVSLLLATGVLSFFSGNPGDAWIFVLHGAGGIALVWLTFWKLRRVWRRMLAPRLWDNRTLAGIFATVFVGATLLSGIVWSSGGDVFVAGFNLLNWHVVLGVLLSLAVLQHALYRAKALRRSDLKQRRQFLYSLGIAGAGFVGWRLQRPANGVLGWRGADRRWTGSYEQGSFKGNAFPETSWISDQPRHLDAETYRLRIHGLVDRPLELPLSALQVGDTLTAALDCTGGFYSNQHWHGVRLDRLIDMAQPSAGATHVRVVSYTGYRWSYSLAEAKELLLATEVGDETLSHGHGAPVRLVAPNRRGFQWVKWVVALEFHAGPDFGALPSTLWSSLTPEGRGVR